MAVIESRGEAQALRSKSWVRLFIDRLRKKAGALARKIIPGVLVQEVSRYRALGSPERSLYLKLKVKNSLTLNSRRVPSGARRFVFVCFGNIMRSPMSEALFREAVARHARVGVKSCSAGLNATPGKRAHPWAIAAAQDFGISLEGHQATLLTREMVDEADAILAMDVQNQVEFLSRYPDAAGRLFLLGAYSGTTSRAIEIRDPFFGNLDETRHCYRLLQTCTQNLADSLDLKSTLSAATSNGG